MAQAQTVADLLSGSQGSANATPPPGFLPAPPPPPPPGFVPEGDAPGGLADIGRGLLGGAVRGVVQLPGMIGDILQGSGIANAEEAVTARMLRDGEINQAEADRRRAENAQQNAAFQHDIAKRVPSTKDIIGVLPNGVQSAANYQPTTEAGRFAESIGNFAPALIPGPSELKGAATVADMLGLAGRQAVKTVAAGTASEAAGEAAHAAGAPPIVETGARLLAGMAGYAGASALAHPEMPVTAKTIVETTPKELMIDPHGELTPDGLEASIRHDIPPERMKAAYEGVTEGPTAAQEVVPEPTAPEAAPIAPESQDALSEPPSAALTPAEPAPVPTAPLNAVPVQPKTAVARLMEAQSLDTPVPLTPGEAAQDPVIQRAENDLKNTSKVAGYKAAIFQKAQNEAIRQNVDTMRASFGDTGLTADARGEVLQNGLRKLEDQGAAGVTAKYNLAKEISGPTTPVEHGGILNAADDVIINKPVEPGTRQALETLLAKYGMLDGEATPSGRYTVVTPKEGSPVKIIGDVTPLTLDNAEQFRQGLNAIYRAEQHGFVGSVTRALDQAVNDAIEQGAAGEKNAAYKEARAARSQQARDFEAKDVISEIVGQKSGAETNQIAPEVAIRRALGSGPNDVASLRRIKAFLLSKKTPESLAAWQAVRAQGVEGILAKARNYDGSYSAERLTSAINQFGRPKLKLLLGEADFNTFMKNERVIRNALIPLPNTVNRSGSGYAAARIAGEAFKKLAAIPILGPAGDLVARGAKNMVSEGMAARTIQRTTNFTLKDAAKLDAKAAQRKLK